MQRIAKSGFLAVLAVVFLCFTANGVTYAEAGLLTGQEKLGRSIYREGSDGSANEIRATLNLTEDRLSASLFPCANCHGLAGEGKQEGGLIVPPVSAESLFPSRGSSTSPRLAYDDNTLIRAITQGINVQNKPLSDAMPRYQLTEAQALALAAYLKRLGADNAEDDGVTASEIRLASLLPLSGSLIHTGQLLKATLEACVGEINRQGSIYGRKLVLTTIDSGQSQEEVVANSQRLINEIKPFVVVSGYFPKITPDLDRLFTQENLPVIAPLTFQPNEIAELLSSIFYFLPSYADQARAVINFWASEFQINNKKRPAKLAFVFTEKTSGMDLAYPIETQIRRYNGQLALQMQVEKTTNLKNMARLVNAAPDAVFFLGDYQEFSAFNQELAKTEIRPIFLGLLSILGSDILQNPAAGLSRLLIATPFTLYDNGLTQFATLLKRYALALENPSLQRLACAAVQFAVAGIKEGGKHLTRNKFAESLEKIHNFQLGIMPSPTFSPGKRFGAKGAYILQLEPNESKASVFQSTWIQAE